MASRASTSLATAEWYVMAAMAMAPRRDMSTQCCSCPGRSRASTMELRLCCDQVYCRATWVTEEMDATKQTPLAEDHISLHSQLMSWKPAPSRIFSAKAARGQGPKADLKPMTRLEANDLKIQRSRGMNWALWEQLWTATSTPATLR